MNNLQRKLATLAAIFALALQTVAPAAAAVNITVSGNGSDSESEVEIDNDRNTEVYQENKTKIVNNITSNSNTGDNDVEDNTGGDVEVKTGDVETSATVINEANKNMAHVEDCDCDTDTTVKVAGNGTDSDNEVEIDNKSKNTVVQDNYSFVKNDVDLEGDSGDNDVEDNTGGKVKVKTGDVKIKPVTIANVLGVNAAHIGGSNGDETDDDESSVIDLTIAGNGSDSENEVEIDNRRRTGIYQENRAKVINDLYLDGNTGDNSVSDNTGESTTDPSLKTGDVEMEAFVMNEAGFNQAVADCGCVMDVTGEVSENGTDSENEIELDLSDKQTATQDNYDFIYNDGELDADTGDNEVDDNTSGEVNVKTGGTTTVVDVFNFGGNNGYGVEIELPSSWAAILGLL